MDIHRDGHPPADRDGQGTSGDVRPIDAKGAWHSPSDPCEKPRLFAGGVKQVMRARGFLRRPPEAAPPAAGKSHQETREGARAEQE